jgi:hypothetical protein
MLKNRNTVPTYQFAIKGMPPIYSHGKYITGAQHHWAEQVFSYKTLLFRIVISTGYAFLPEMNKSLHALLIKIAQEEVTHFFIAVITASSGKCCQCSPSFISLNIWKSEGAKSRLYGRCGRTVQQVLTNLHSKLYDILMLQISFPIQ